MLAFHLSRPRLNVVPPPYSSTTRSIHGCAERNAPRWLPLAEDEREAQMNRHDRREQRLSAFA